MSQRPATETALTSLHELSALLVRERDVLHLIALELAEADDEDTRDMLLRSVSSLELHRAISARAVAAELGMDREPTLRELVERAPCEWRGVLDEHLRDLASLSREIEALVRPAVVDLRREGNVIAFPQPARGLQRSLVDFLA